VSDLAAAHLLVLEALKEKTQLIYNLGNGQGFSVRQVIDTVRKVTGHAIPAPESPRRPAILLYLWPVRKKSSANWAGNRSMQTSIASYAARGTGAERIPMATRQIEIDSPRPGAAITVNYLGLCTFSRRPPPRFLRLLSAFLPCDGRRVEIRRNWGERLTIVPNPARRSNTLCNLKRCVVSLHAQFRRANRMSGTTVCAARCFCHFWRCCCYQSDCTEQAAIPAKSSASKKVPSVNCPTEPKSNSSLFTTARARLQK